MIDFRLYLITDRRLFAERIADTANAAARDVAIEATPETAVDTSRENDIVDAIETACRAGVRAVQLREKDLAAKPLYEMALRIRQSTKKYGAALIVNERVDIALAAGADGIHCPERGFPVSAAGELLGSSAVIGASTHSVDSARRAEQNGAHLVTFGPVFETRSKIEHGDPQGLQALRTVADAVSIPVFAVGGITPERARSCLEHGAAGVSVISAVLAADDIARAVREFKSALGAL